MIPISRKSIFLILGLTALIPFLWFVTSNQSVSAQSQIPLPPMFLEGAVTIVSSAAVDGVIVTARTIIDGTVISGSTGLCGTKSGRYGSSPCTNTNMRHLRVASDDPNTRVIDGGRNGDVVQILISGSIVATTTFASGTVEVINVTRTTPLPTPTPTPQATATPTPSGPTATPAAGGGGGGGAIGTVPTGDDLKTKTASESATQLDGLPAGIITDILLEVLTDVEITSSAGESKVGAILSSLLTNSDNIEVVSDILLSLGSDADGIDQAGRLIVSMVSDGDSFESVSNTLTLLTKTLEGQARVGSMLQKSLSTDASQENIAKVFDLLSEDSEGQAKVAEIFRVIASSADGAADGGGVIGNMASTIKGVERAANILSFLAADADGAKLAGALIDGTASSSAGVFKSSDILTKMSVKIAASVIQSVSLNSRISIAQIMPTASLADRLQEVSPTAIFANGMTSVLLKRLTSYPVEQLVPETPPTIDPLIPGPEVLATIGNLSMYQASKTSSTDWTKLVGSPLPIDSVLGKFTSSLTNVKINVDILTRAPSDSNLLPDNQTAYKYFNIDIDGAEDTDVSNGHLTFYIADEWFLSTSFAKWSVFLYRLDVATGDWISFPTKRINETGNNVYYTATVPGFSSFAIGASASVPAPKFIVSDLIFNPESPAINEAVSVSARVTNTSGSAASYTGTIWVDNQANGTTLASVGAGESKIVDFGIISLPEGLHEIRVERQIKTLNVGGVVVPSATKAPSKVTPSTPEVKSTAVPSVAVPTSSPKSPSLAEPTAAPVPTSAPEPTTAPEPTAVIANAESDSGSNNLSIIIIAFVAFAVIGGIAAMAIRRRS
jgi:PGF-pre-PGF domain-containing protein